ncbi:efflux RND transporter periplasmic adaptor subunit [Falcatimonas sp. MSJ-15]|uniref:efflux RND transporter periplasmic adaptor subunit n=1 Tax=Falcatimonas sp. MSJ-15 TaxID=2841515 RepID=UPI001C10CB94|nr:efflux RND transporter periplasmic adaptor subunit [Falcatimonas sp. MSJ-15]MBU5468794.1 efflux RND transporter periplasmic adaptor subunit [Falcatimonas sp. MSJ-15]
MRKKIIITVAAVVAVAVVGTGIWFAVQKSAGGSDNGEKAYVESVADITGSVGEEGIANNFSGVVEPQKTENIKVDSTKKVKEILVSVGDSVDINTPLFSYDTEDIALNISQANLELERINNNISSYTSQIAQLEKDKQTAPESEKLSYTTQIQAAQIDQKKEEYNKTVKELEIQKLNDSLNNTAVLSTMSGIIKSINQNGGVDNQTGEELPFMTILATGDFRVKGTINEQNVYEINTGDKVIVQSRADATKTWTGTIESIDKENPVSSNDNMYGSDDSSVKSTKYNFYVTLDGADGLMLGQHVYVREDLAGQGITAKTGIWIYDWYVVKESEDNAYVWAETSKGTLEKRKVTLGDYDETMGQYEIKDGLSTDDYIAFPEDWFEEGTKTKKMEDDAGNNDMSLKPEVNVYDIRA